MMIKSSEEGKKERKEKKEKIEKLRQNVKGSITECSAFE